MAESRSDPFARLAPEELDALLARVLGDGHGNHRILAMGVFRGYLTESLLALAGHPRSEGTFVVVDEESERALFFSRGKAVGASSNVLFEQLGRVLYKGDLVTHEDAEALVQFEDADGAQELIGCLPDDALRWAVEQRVRGVAAALPYVSRGRFWLLEGEAPLGELPRTDLDPVALGEEARRLYDAWRQGPSEDGGEARRADDAPAPVTDPLRPPRTREEEIQDILRQVRKADLR